MKLEGVRQKVFLDRYSLKDEEGKPVEQTPEEMWKRVAKGIAKVEKEDAKPYWEKKFYQAMQEFKFVPGGRVLAGAGTGYAVTFYNCFVIPSPKDSRDGIMDNVKVMIEIMARGGGVGVNISSLRPRGARVKKVNGFSSGPINWAGMYSLATHDIIQQGGSRRGALMLMLWDWHPDIEEFITVKQDLSRINGANLSVCASDKFMDAVKKDKDWDLVFPDTSDPEYDLKWDGILDHWLALGKKVKVYKTIKARYLWDLICKAAWQSAEPGLVFMERYNKWYNNWYWNTINCVNPCGEEGLPAWGVCNLASLNLSAFVKGYSVDKAGTFDYKSLAEYARVAVRFQDDVVDADQYFYEEIEQMQHQGERRIGLGTLGLADALIKLHVRYGSDAAIPVVDKIYKTIRDAAYDESINIAKEKGPFPKIDIKKHLKGYFIKQLPKEVKEKMKKYGIRNSMLLQAAPTGTTSLLSGASSGVEPVYEFEYTHNGRLGKQTVFHNLFGDWKKAHPDEKRPDYFVGANDLIPEDHVKMQAVVQKYVDASISKTVNAPNAHSVEDVKKLYMMAYDMGCKGITYMRDGSRLGVLQRVEEKKEAIKVEEKPAVIDRPIINRPMQLEGVTYQIQTPLGKTFITINHNENKEPFEMFITIGKSGSDISAMAEALGRVISLNLRLNSSLSPRERIRQIVAQLTGIGGAGSVGFGKERVRSLPDAIAKALAKQYDFTVNGKVEDRQIVAAGLVDPKAALTDTPEVNGINTNGAIKPNGLTNGHSNGVTIQNEGVVVMQQLSIGGEAASVSSSTGLFDICPDCGSASLAYEEGCKKCYSCGYSAC